LIFPNENKIPNNLWDGALYITQNLLLLPGLFDITPIITVAWSLSYELFYYLLIPLIIALLNLRKWTLKQRVIFWVAVSIVGFIYFQIYGGPYRFLMFISGILLYEVFKNKLIEPPRYIGNFAFLMAFGTYAFAQHLELSGIIQMATLYLFFFVVCLEAFSNNDGSAVWLNITPIRWLGNMSYSYYLIHGLTLKACFMFLALIESPQKQFDTIFWLAMPILFFATLISSFILFILVERTFSLKQNNRRAIIEVNKKMK
jgi:peptidoglycan/LPS O-acetylase OafA/YrhL